MKASNQTFVALLGIGLVCTPLLSSAATESFTYIDAADNNLSATFTVNETGGVATGGTGTATSNEWSGVSNLVLLTPTTVLPFGAGSIIAPSGGTFGWQAVPGSSGTNISGIDTDFSATAPYVDTNGVMFELINPGTHAVIGGFTFWADSNGTNTTYSDLIVGAGTGYLSQGNSSGTLLPVPEPESYALTLGGLALAAWSARRRAAA